MRRIAFWLITALLTFTLGVIANSLWVRQNHPSQVVSAKTGEVNLKQIYINQDLQWESPPKVITDESGVYKVSVNERILVFYSDGQFASIGCAIYQVGKPQRMMLVPNEGFTVHKGTWKQSDDGTIIVTSRLTASNKLADDPDGKLHAELIERFINRKAANDQLADKLELNGRVFIPSPYIEGIGDLLAFPDGDI